MARRMYLALHDVLTGLRNRTAFEEDFQKKLKNTEQKTVLFMLDLDNFKQVNDKLGHDVGDQLLREVGQTIKKTIPKKEPVYRFDGDEFGILLPYTNMQSVEETARKVIDAIYTASSKLLRNQIYVTASVGAAISQYDGEDMETLYKHADIALYESKEKGKNQYHIYT